MQTCAYDLRSQSRCANSPVFNFEYCLDHLQTPRGMTHVQDRILNGAVLTVTEVESYIADRCRPSEIDYHTSALEKMAAIVDEILGWIESCKLRLDDVPEDEWRYQDRARTEQVRSEFTAYERALDRGARVLKDVSKMALQDKIISLGRAQTDLIVRILMSVIEDMKLTSQQFAQARALLLEKFQMEANLSGRHEQEVTLELTNAQAVSDYVNRVEAVDGQVIEYASQ